jgi:cytosine/uracil/thiamine/allantoin permease
MKMIIVFACSVAFGIALQQVVVRFYGVKALHWIIGILLTFLIVAGLRRVFKNKLNSN